MARANVLLAAFNRGLISPLAFARTDLDRLALSAETQTNWMPRTLGSMMLRPGLEYQNFDLAGVTGSKKLIPFMFDKDDKAIIALYREGFDYKIRVLADSGSGMSEITFNNVSTTVDNVSSSAWIDDDDAGATSVYSSGTLDFVGTGYAFARRYQEVTVSGGDQGTAHSVWVSVSQGWVFLKVGTSQGDDFYINKTRLDVGDHVIRFTPTTSSVFIELESSTKYTTEVSNVDIRGSGDDWWPNHHAWPDVSTLRTAQSGDIIYCAHDTAGMYKIERRNNNSWSLVDYAPEDGPFLPYNQTGITLTPSAISGDITLTASASLFQPGHRPNNPNNSARLSAGALFRIDSSGQYVESDVSGADQWSNSIRVSGVGGNRNFTVAISSIGSNTVTLQRSIAEPGAWVDVATYTSNTSGTVFSDGLDNQIIYYRIGIKSGDYSSGTTTVSLEASTGSITGILRVTAVSSSTSASAIVIKDLGGTDATTSWAEGAWSSYRGFPTAVALHEGRLWWAGRQNVFASVSDAYESFDDEVIGDAGPIFRSISFSTAYNINWIIPSQRLLVGTPSFELSIRSSAFDEPITQTNFTIKASGTQGSMPISPSLVDARGIYAQASEQRIHELSYDPSVQDYQNGDLTVLNPGLLSAGIAHIASQRQPDTRIHAVLSDGTVALQVNDQAENVLCWVMVETDGDVIDAVTFQGDDEDDVYYLVDRTNGTYLEKWAKESECQGGTINKQVDSFVEYSGSSTGTITGLDHLDGETVYVWGEGKDLGSYTVASGQITLSEAVTSCTVGLYYKADYKSTKLAYAAQAGTALLQKKRIPQLGVILRNTHYQGLKYGRDFSNLQNLPGMKDGKAVAEDTVYSDYDEPTFPFGGNWDTDARLCLRAESPRPCTVLAAVIGIDTHDKV